MYCDFYSIANREEAIPRFVKAIITEIERCEVDTSDWMINTIYNIIIFIHTLSNLYSQCIHN